MNGYRNKTEKSVSSLIRKYSNRSIGSWPRGLTVVSETHVRIKGETTYG